MPTGISGLYKNTKGARLETLNDYENRMNQKRKQELEKAREYFKDILRVLIDNFGMEKHPEKIEAVRIAIELIEKEIAMIND